MQSMSEGNFKQKEISQISLKPNFKAFWQSEEGFQRCGFLYLPVWYSSTKFSIIKPSINIPWSWKFNLSFEQTSKQLYSKLLYKENVFRKFQCFPRFPRNFALYSLTKFGIKKPWANIPWLRRFDLGFWETSK